MSPLLLLLKGLSCGGKVLDSNMLSSKINYGRYDKEKYLESYNDPSSGRVKTMKQNGVVLGSDKKYFSDPIGCRIYLAKSAIPNTGLGMYSTVDISDGEMIGFDEIVVGIFDSTYHMGTEGWNFIDYYWDSATPDPPLTYEAYEGSVMIPGVGAAANSARGLEN